jgi:hypothetical protein
MSDITELLARVASTGAQSATEQGRYAALKAAKALVNALEAPVSRRRAASGHWIALDH